MTKDQARILLNGLVADGLDVAKLTASGRSEIRRAIDVVLEMTCQHNPCACQDAGMFDPATCDFVGVNTLRSDLWRNRRQPRSWPWKYAGRDSASPGRTTDAERRVLIGSELMEQRGLATCNMRRN